MCLFIGKYSIGLSNTKNAMAVLPDLLTAPALGISKVCEWNVIRMQAIFMPPTPHSLCYQTLVLPPPSLLPHLHHLTLPVSLWYNCSCFTAQLDHFPPHPSLLYSPPLHSVYLMYVNGLFMPFLSLLPTRHHLPTLCVTRPWCCHTPPSFHTSTTQHCR